jgi:PAS domain S-box-containing protein
VKKTAKKSRPARPGSRRNSGKRAITNRRESTLASAKKQTGLGHDRVEADLRYAKQELERNTQELANSLATMRAIFESSTDGILVTNGDGRTVDFNENYLNMWRVPRDVLLEKDDQSLRKLVSLQLREPQKFLARLNDILQSTAPESFDLLEFKDGRVFERYSKLQRSDNRSRIWTFHDVTVHQQAQIASRRLAAIIDSSNDAIVAKDLNGIVTSWNAGAERIFGYTAAEMIGSSIKRIIPRDRYAEEEDILARIRRGEHIDHFETARVKKGGALLDVSVTISPLKNSEGQVVGASKIARDVTDRKRAENEIREAMIEAEKANKAKDEFLAALSHELRTPLTPVLMTATALREDEALPVYVRERLAMMERNIALEARLIDDLLDITTITRGKLNLFPQHCDIHSLINLALEFVQDEARTREISIEFEFTALNCGLLIDPGRFQQVIWNLLRNAVKFTPEGGRIFIRTSNVTRKEQETWLRLEVNDSGIGIEPSALEKIFLPFEQGSLAGNHRFGGLGLGLAIARAIVELHRGTISAHSAGPHQGATFIVEFPNAIPPPSGIADVDIQLPLSKPSQEVSTEGGEPRRGLKRLLLVEDHEPTLQVISTLLSRDGYEVITASSVAGALTVANTGRFDLVISDLGLPDGTGITLMQKLREAYGLRGIALSGYGMEEDQARSLEAGFVAHLVKPVRVAELRRVLATVKNQR